METKDSIADKSLAAINGFLNSGLDICMGVGKTRISIRDMENIMKEVENPTFLIVCKGPVEENWIKQITEYNKSVLNHISFCTYSSLLKCAKSKNDKVYFDECHNITEKHIPVLSYYQDNKVPVLGITGTYPYNRSTKAEICNRFFPLRFVFTIDQAVENKIVNNYKIYVHYVGLSEEDDLEMTSSSTGKTWMTSERKQYNYYSRFLSDDEIEKLQSEKSRIVMSGIKKFNSKVKYIQELLKHRTKKMLVFANNKQQANQISKYRYYSGIGKIIAENNLNKFKSGEIEVLSTVEQLSEGINIPNLGSVVIAHSYSNPRLFMQKLGRVLRLDPSETAKIHLLCYKDTIDEVWVDKCLSLLDQSKIIKLPYKK